MKQFIDTAPFIYLIEEHPNYTDSIQNFLINRYVNETSFITSVITLSEFGVKPEQTGRLDLIQEFEDFLAKFPIPMLTIQQHHAAKAYQLRAKYQFLNQTFERVIRVKLAIVKD